MYSLSSHRMIAIRILFVALCLIAFSFAARLSSASADKNSRTSSDDTFTQQGASGSLSLIVNTTSDESDLVLNGVCDTDAGTAGDQCSLRAAIQETNNAPTNDTITFAPALNGSTITLTSALDAINGNLVITGPGSDLLTIRRSSAGGTPDFRIFRINPGQTVSMLGLTLTNGSAVGAPGSNSGGGISNDGTLTLSDCVITNNSASASGGGLSNGGSLTVNNSSVSNNTASSGAGINNSKILSGLASVTLNNTIVSGNQATLSGAGIANGAGSGTSAVTLTINNSLISGNVNAGSDGGGVYNMASLSNASNTLVIRNSTISGNSAETGGGIFFATNGQGPTANATIVNSTITNNNGGNATNSGGGIFTLEASGTTFSFILRNVIVADNFRSTGTIRSDIFGPVTSTSRNNLIGVDSGLTGITNGTNSNQIGTAASPIDPRLSPLMNNGGPTQTHALLPGSPALDAGDNTSASNEGLTTDQRGTGFGRIRDAADGDSIQTVDIGAFEADPAIEDISNKSTNEDTPLTFSFNIGDATTPFDSLTAASSNTALVPNENLVFTNNEPAFRSLTITPAPNQFGTTVISVGISKTINGTVVMMVDSFTLTVNSVNDTPTTSGIPDVNVSEDANDSVITLTSFFTDVEDGANGLTYSITANTNPALFSSTILNNGVLTLDYRPDAFGSAGITIRATDAGGLFVESTFDVNIGAVNDAPVNSTPGTQEFPDSSVLVFSSANSNPISVSDVDLDNGFIQMTLSVTNGTLSLPVTNGLIFTTGDGIDDSTMTFSGTLTSVNAALNGLTFKPTQGFTGAVALTITSNDLGNRGNGGPLTDTDVVNINVLATFSFSSATYSADETDGSATITVNRTGSTAQAVSVDYATTDSSATERKDYTTAAGTLTIPAGQTSASFAVLLTVDSFNEGSEIVGLVLTNTTPGMALGAIPNATLQINNVPNALPNANDDPGTFVDQHYHDFLNRVPDAAGRQFWVSQITDCNGDPVCIEVKRINTSAAFFVSIEFQETGFTAFLTHRAAFGPTLPAYRVFERDTQALQRGFAFGTSGADAILEANKVKFFDSFVERPEFTAIFGTLTNAQYVDLLIARTGVVFTAIERDALVSGLDLGTETRSTVLRKIVEKNSFKLAEFNRAFVYMQYVGYLRRNPTDLPDTNLDGFNFWLNKLNQFNGNYLDAEMVKAFIQSIEYRGRFAP